jgi:hypothetical protein
MDSRVRIKEDYHRVEAGTREMGAENPTRLADGMWQPIVHERG